MKEEFDPLANNENDSSFDDIIASSKKRLVKNILKSYVGTFDSFAELIQNAMDSVEKRARSEDKSFKKQLDIYVNLQENSFSIVDNGIGFDDKEFQLFLAPNISFKEGNNTRGNKGVGATYIAYGFNYLQIGTKNEKFSFLGEIIDGRKWAEDTNNIVVRPTVKRSKDVPIVFENLEKGAYFKIKYGGDYTRPKDLSYFGTNAEQWLYVLLLKTPLGSLFDNESPTFFNLSVIDSKGAMSLIENQKAEYIYPHLKINPSRKLQDIIEASKQIAVSGKELPAKFKSLYGIYDFFTKDDIKNLRSSKLKDNKDYIDLIDKYHIEAYGFFGYSTSLWDEFNDSVAKLRKSYRIIKGGLLMANNHMIQGDYISIPLTSNIGYQNQVHVVVHFNNADPDLGRKGFQPELKELAEIISVGIVNNLKIRRKLLKNDTGEKPILTEQTNLHNWILSQEIYEKENPLIIKNPHFFKPINEISISSIPQTEQDVIVLFNQLIAGGVIRGIKLLATNQHQTYDGLFKYYIEEPVENHLFEKEKNPLGVKEYGIKVGTKTHPLVLEYKFNLNGLFQEFESGDKFEKNIDLAIAWEMGDKWKKNYEICSFLDLDNLHLRPFHGITHLITSQSGNSFYLVILKELVEYLNDINSAQKKQKQLYEDID